MLPLLLVQPLLLLVETLVKFLLTSNVQLLVPLGSNSGTLVLQIPLKLLVTLLSLTQEEMPGKLKEMVSMLLVSEVLGEVSKPEELL